METRLLSRITPVRLRAKVVRGFGRGSKQLGFPTANLEIRWDADVSQLSEEERTVRDFATSHRTGIYCAWGCVEGAGGAEEQVHKVAMSMGWNPTFDDVKAKTIEPWILHHFTEDFYDSYLRLLVLAYVRPEVKFESTEHLKHEIAADGEFCRASLSSPDLAAFQQDPFLKAWEAKQKPPLFRPHVITSASLKETLQSLPPVEPGFARLLLTRHGETDANQQGILCGGDNDSQLNSQGHNCRVSSSKRDTPKYYLFVSKKHRV
eukprot:Skav233626  [mRNA]  locus=scaffold492:22796:23584:+ [translate_table: standard]